MQLFVVPTGAFVCEGRRAVGALVRTGLLVERYDVSTQPGRVTGGEWAEVALVVLRFLHVPVLVDARYVVS